MQLYNYELSLQTNKCKSLFYNNLTNSRRKQNKAENVLFAIVTGFSEISGPKHIAGM